MFSIQEVSELGRILELKEAEVTFGRGPFLGVTDKRVSRHHGTLKQVGNGIEIKSIHVNPCFYARKSDPEKWLKLDKNETTILKPGDVFSLLPESHIYKVLRENFTGKNGEKVTETGVKSENNVIQSKEDDKKCEKLIKLPKTHESLEADKETKIDNNSSVDDNHHEKHSKNLNTAEIISSARENQEIMGSLSPKKEHPVKATPVVITPIKVNPKKHSDPIPTTRSSSSNTFMDGEKEIAFPVERKRKLPTWMISVDKNAQKEPKTPVKTPKKTNKNTPKTSTAKKNRQNIKAMHFESDSDETEGEILQKTKTNATSENLTDDKKVKTINADGGSTAQQTTGKQKETSSNIEQDDFSNNTTEKKHLSKNLAVEDADITSEDVEMVDASVLAQTTTEKTRSSKDQKTTSETVAQSNLQQSDTNDAASDYQQTSSSSRASCAYGSSCYRRNPAHLQAFSHPGDPDYVDPEGSDDDDDSNRPECPYGRSCYRKHPLHKKQFKHTRRVAPKRVAKMRAQRQQDGESSSDDYDDSFINDDESEDDVDEGASDEEDEDWNPSQGSQSQKTTRKSVRNRRRKRKSYQESDSDATTDDEEDLDDLVADAKDFARNKKMWKK